VESTSDFLARLLQYEVDESHPLSSYRERIEAGVALVDQQYLHDPMLHGRMLVFLGGIYASAQEARRADELYQRAYEVGRESHDPELMSYALCERVHNDTFAGSYADTTQRLAQARQLLERIDHPDADLQATCLTAQSRVEVNLGHFSAAEKLSLQAKRVVEEDGSTYRPIYGDILSQLSNLYLNSDRPRDMLRTMELLGRIEDSNGRGHTSERMWTHQNIASALISMGEIRDAMLECTLSNQGLAELSGSGVLPIANVINYAGLLGRMGRSEEALKSIEIAIQQARSAGNQDALLRALLVKGKILLSRERWDEADLVLNEAASHAAGDRSGHYVSTLLESYRMLLDMARGHLESAHRHRDRSLQLAGYHTESSPLALGRVLQMAAEVALAERASADAEQYAQDALTLFERLARGSDTSADVGEALLHLAQARAGRGPKAEVRSLLTRAVRCLSNGLSPDHPLTVRARTLLATQS